MRNPTHKAQWSKKVMFAFMLPAIIFYVVMALIPSCLTAFYSLTDITGTSRSWNFIGISNYKKLFVLANPRDTWNAIYRTIIFAVVCTVVKNVLALLIALLFNDKAVRGRSLYRAVTFMPTILGATVCCYAWVLLLSMDGPVYTLLNSLGIKSGLLGSKTDAFPLVMIIQIWMSVGYAMVIDIAGLQGIPSELYEAAALDGAGSFRTFFSVTLPQLWPTLSVNVLLTIVGSLGSVQPILLTTGGANNTETLAMRMYAAAFGVGKSDATIVDSSLGYASATAIVLFAITLVFALGTNFLMQRQEKKYES